MIRKVLRFLLLATILIIPFIIHCGVFAESTWDQKAVSWLFGQRRSDGSWGKKLDYQTTALILAGSQGLGWDFTNRIQDFIADLNQTTNVPDLAWQFWSSGDNNLYQKLLSLKAGNGSWDDDPFLTALIQLEQSSQGTIDDQAKNYLLAVAAEMNALTPTDHIAAVLSFLKKSEPNNPLRLSLAGLLHNTQLPDGSWGNGPVDTAWAVWALGAGDTVVKKGIAYLNQAQNTDGGWGDSQAGGSRIETTAIVFHALASIDPANQAIQSIIDYLWTNAADPLCWYQMGSAVAISGETMRALLLAHTSGDAINQSLGWILSMSPQSTTDLTAQVNLYQFTDIRSERTTQGLLSRQNSDGGFGPSQGASSNILDTALAIQAIVILGNNPEVVSRGVEYLITVQGDDGSWSLPKMSSINARLYITSQAALALSQGGKFGPELQKAVNWLLSQRNSDFGWGAGHSIPWLSGLSYLAMVRSRLGFADGESTRSFLLNSQELDGSWQKSVWATATVLRALKETEVNLRFEGLLSTEPSNVIAGENTKLQATIVNDGGTTVNSIPVSFAEEVNGQLIALGPTITIPKLLAGEKLVIEYPNWQPTLGNHKVVVLIDPQNTLGEQNRFDNNLEAEIWSSPATAPDLFMMDDGITLNPAKPVDGETTIIKARIRNRGNTAATAVVVRFFDGAVQIGNDQLIPEIVPAQSVYLQVNWVAREGTHVIEVRIDPENTVVELDETNNSLIKSVVVNLVRPPAAPEGLAGTAEDAAVFLTWNANRETDIAGYHIYRNGARANNSLVLNTEYYDENLINGNFYDYTVTAVNTYGLESAPSVPISIAPLQGLLPPTYIIYPGSSHRTAIIKNDKVNLIGVSDNLNQINVNYGDGKNKNTTSANERVITLEANDGAAIWENLGLLPGQNHSVGMTNHNLGWELAYEANELPTNFNLPFTVVKNGTATETVANGNLSISSVGTATQLSYQRAIGNPSECSVEWRIAVNQVTDGKAILDIRNGLVGASLQIYNGGINISGASQYTYSFTGSNQYHTYQLTLRNRYAYLYIDGQVVGAYLAGATTDRLLIFGARGNIKFDVDAVRFSALNRRPLPREAYLRWCSLDFRSPVTVDGVDWDSSGEVGIYSFAGRLKNLAANATYQYEVNPSNLNSDQGRTILKDGQSGSSAPWIYWNGTNGQVNFDLGSPCYLQSVRSWLRGGETTIKSPDKIEVYTSVDGIVYRKRGSSSNILDLSGQWVETKIESTWVRYVRIIYKLRSGNIYLNEVELLGGNWSPVSRGQNLGSEPVTLCARLTRASDLETPSIQQLSFSGHAPIGKGLFLATLDTISEGRSLVRATALTQGTTQNASIELLGDYTPPLISLNYTTKGFVGQPYLFDADKSYDATGISYSCWNFDDGNVDADLLNVAHVFPFAAKFKVMAGLWDQAGNYNSIEREVEITEQIARVICVPWQGQQPHPTWTGKTITLKGTCKGFSGTINYTWDFGDGTPVKTGSVSDSYNISATHAYIGAIGTPIQATLTVTDTSGRRASNTYKIIIKGQTQQVERDVAIDEGLWWMHCRQTRNTYSAGQYQTYAIPYGYWSESSYTITPTGATVEAMENNGHLPSGDPETDPYVETVQRGLAYLMTKIKKTDINQQLAGNPDTNYNGYGLGLESSQEIYEIGIIMMAIVGSQNPNIIAETGPATYVRGRTYRQILQDMVDYCAWAQTDSNYTTFRGGWRYSANSANSDNSVTQWPVIGLAAAETAPWGIFAPQFVKSELDMWLAYSQNANGAFGYTGPNEWLNVAKTAAGICCLAYTGKDSNCTAVQKAVNFINQNWTRMDGTSDAHFGNLYAMYAVMKAARLSKPQLTKFGEHDWMWEPGRKTAYPHELVFDLGQSRQITKVKYTPRQDSDLGRVKDYDIYISDSTQSWGEPIKTGTMTSGMSELIIPLTPQIGRYLRFRGISEVNNRSQMSVAEFKIYYLPGGNTAPLPPSGAGFIPISATALMIGWSDQSDNETGFIIERCMAGSANWEEIGRTGPNVNTLNDSGLQPETSYSYRISAYNDSGRSAVSETVTGKTMTLENQILGTDAPMVATADTNSTSALLAIDNNSQTLWRSSTAATPHEIILDLGAVYDLVGLRYLGNQVSSVGRIKDLEVYISDSTNLTGTPVAVTTLSDTNNWQAMIFSKTKGRYIRIRGLNAYGNTREINAAEIVLLLGPDKSGLAINGFLTSKVKTISSVEIEWQPTKENIE